MRYFIPAWIAITLAVTACSPKSTLNSAADIAVSAEDASNHEMVAAPADEAKIVTGIRVDVCKLPSLSEDVETDPSTLEQEFASCGNDSNKPIDVAIKNEISFSLNDSSLAIAFFGKTHHSDSLDEFANFYYSGDEREDLKMEKDKVMSDRFGFETLKVTYRSDFEEDDVKLTEGYCFACDNVDYCITIENHGHELDEFKDALVSNMQLVMKTGAELEREYLEKQKKEKEEMVENYGGMPKIKMQILEVNGNIDKRIIQKVVRAHSGELRACYEKELVKSKGINGKIIMRWLITPQGMASKAEVKESTFDNSVLENCFTESINRWRFPATKNGMFTELNYQFDLLTEMPD